MIGSRRGTCAVVALVACGLVMWQPVAGASTDCSGRPALTCSERTALYDDALDSAIAGSGSLELFQAPGPERLSNPALAQFWRFEAAAGITGFEIELGIGSQGNDLSFEQVAVAARSPAPRIKASGIVKRHVARILSRLLGAEQQEIVNLVAMDVSLNRATGAVIRGRQDWASYQTYQAAIFARRAANAIRLAISRQRAATKALLGAGLQFGIGAADQRAAQRYVRKHGWPAAIERIMLNLGMNSTTLLLAKTAFLHASLSGETYSMSHYLSSARVITEESRCATALQQFAAGVPSAPLPR